MDTGQPDERSTAMDTGQLLTSAGINITVCVSLFLLYSVLRKQPSNRIVYFGRRITQRRYESHHSLERFVPSPGWIVKAWEATEEEIMAAGGMDAVIFLRSLIFSIRIFTIAAIVGMCLVIPVNYHGTTDHQKVISAESLKIFSIVNVQGKSKWFWCHCLALYIITFSACALLYLEYKSISNMKLEHVTKSASKPSHFTILVRAIPWSPGESYGDTLKKFFTNYHGSGYLSHHMVYCCGTIKKFIDDAEKMCNVLTSVSTHRPNMRISCFCAGSINSFTPLSEGASVKEGNSFSGVDPATRDNECPAAFVFFKSRYEAALATQMTQSSNPLLWVTEMAPEPDDVLWSSLSIRYRQLWLRKLGTLLVTTVFMFVFVIPVGFVQSLIVLDKITRIFPFLKGLLDKGFIGDLVTGYLPSVVLMLFLYTVPPLMSSLSTIEGPISHSERKKSTCKKIVFFYIWNIFFLNIATGGIIKNFTVRNSLEVFLSVKEIPSKLAEAILNQSNFYMTYVLTSGWASIGCEIMQLFPLLCNLLKKLILRKKNDSKYWLMSFPYHTELPRVLLFGLLGLTCAVTAPLILPFLLVYFILAHLVYKNQILNVYLLKYDTGGRYWPIIHNTTIFSLILAQVIAVGLFITKEAPVASGFTAALIFLTIIFNEYCRKRFLPIFQKDSTQVLIDLDRRDVNSGRKEEILQQLPSKYCQFSLPKYNETCESSNPHHHGTPSNAQSSETGKELIVSRSLSWTGSDLEDEKKAAAEK